MAAEVVSDAVIYGMLLSHLLLSYDDVTLIGFVKMCGFLLTFRTSHSMWTDAADLSPFTRTSCLHVASGDT